MIAMQHVRFSCRLLLSVSAVCLLFGAAVASPQGGLRAGGRPNLTLNVILEHPDQYAQPPLTREKMALFDGGVSQTIESLSYDSSPARVVLLVDNSASSLATVEALQKICKAVLGELYAEDQVMLVDFSEGAEILESFTPDINKLNEAMKGFKKKGAPHLFDAAVATIYDALMQALGIEKRVIILVSDGFDRGSQTTFDQMMAELWEENVVVYAIQLPDRTYGAVRRDTVKPVAAIEKMTTGTGGKAFKVAQVETASKEIAGEIRKGWYKITYTPEGVNLLRLRRLLVTVYQDGVTVRTKSEYPKRDR